jgi:hypothetical protein
LALDISKLDKKTIFKVLVKDRIPTEIDYISSLTVPVFNSLLENCTIIADVPSKYVDGTEVMRPTGIIHAYSGIMYLKNQMNRLKSENPIQALTTALKKAFQGKYKTAFIKEAT